MRDSFLPFSPPYIDEEDRRALDEVLRSGWISTGPKTSMFEQEFLKATSGESALALNSCTAGLHLALRVLEIGPGDEVITTPMTFCASANVIEHVGATTCFVDVDPATLLIDPRKIEARITEKTKAIIPVHYAGQLCDMGRINKIASDNGLHVIEDGAHLMPADLKGNKNLVAFSFYANKNITTGEGGMLVGPEDLIKRARVLSLHGMNKDAWKRYDKSGSWKYDVVIPGYKYNMTDLQAAMGLTQLKKLDHFYEHRKEAFIYFTEALRGVEGVEPIKTDFEKSSFHLFVVRIKKEILGLNRDEFVESMKKKNIGVSVHYQSLHTSSYYSQKYGSQKENLSHAGQAGEEVVSLPISPSYSKKDYDDIIFSLRSVVSLR